MLGLRSGNGARLTSTASDEPGWKLCPLETIPCLSFVLFLLDFMITLQQLYHLAFP